VKYAHYNELGVMGPPFSQHGDGKWFIPPRSFMRNFADGKREEIEKTKELFVKLVAKGKKTAKEAANDLGMYGQSGIKSSITKGNYTENADSTILRKGDGKNPLVDSSTLRKSIHYQVIDKSASGGGE
jgi:hypothetical protein